MGRSDASERMYPPVVRGARDDKDVADRAFVTNPLLRKLPTALVRPRTDGSIEPLGRMWCSSSTVADWGGSRARSRGPIAIGLAVLITRPSCSPSLARLAPGTPLGRPLHLPRVAPALPAPFRTASREHARSRPARMPVAGPGPVYPMASVTIPQARLASRVLTLRVGADKKRHGSPALATRVRSLIRGARIDAPGELRFARSTGDRLPALQARRGQAVQPNGWRVWPGLILVRTPGCYALQVDGLNFSRVIVIRVHALATWPYQ